MFSGLIEKLGRIDASEGNGADLRLRVATGWQGNELPRLGDSLAINGVCLTVVERAGDRVSLDVSAETLSCTSLGTLALGDPVNLERALLPTTRLGGHFVSGHVDAMAAVIDFSAIGESYRLRLEMPPALGRYIAAKGSLTVDGVSLTVNKVVENQLEINLIPHTMTMTTLGQLQQGQRVNIEVDLLARYLERLLSEQKEGPTTSDSALTASRFESLL